MKSNLIISNLIIAATFLVLCVVSSSNSGGPDESKKRPSSSTNLLNYHISPPGLRTQEKLKQAAISGTLSLNENGLTSGISEEYLLFSLGKGCDLITLSINNNNLVDLQEFLHKFSSSDFFITILFHFIEKKLYDCIESISHIASNLVEGIDTKRELFDKVISLNDNFEALFYIIKGGIDPSAYSYAHTSIPRLVIETNNHKILNLLIDEYSDCLMNLSNEVRPDNEPNYFPICYANTVETLKIFFDGMREYLSRTVLKKIFFNFISMRKISFAHHCLSIRTRVAFLRSVPDEVDVIRYEFNVPRASALDYFYGAIGLPGAEDYDWYLPYPDMKINFINEDGLDYGGLYIEFLSILLDEMFLDSSSTSIFFTDGPIFSQIDSLSGLVAPNPLYSEEIIKFAGSILALAFLKNIPVKSRFIPFVYKCLLGKSVDFDDLREHDPEAYKHLSFLLSDTVNFEELDLEFFSSTGLVADAENVPFFIDDQIFKICELPFQSQVYAFVSGFKSILNDRSIGDFISVEEFKLIFHGRSTVDVNDFEKNVDFSKLDKNTTNWLIEIFSAMTDAEKLSLIRFITGFNSIPYNGLSGFAHKINISFSPGSDDEDEDNSEKKKRSLPTAHTCFSSFIIPECESMEDLKERIMLAINNCNTFEFC